MTKCNVYNGNAVSRDINLINMPSKKYAFIRFLHAHKNAF